MREQAASSTRRVAMTTRQQFWVYAIVLLFLLVPIWTTVDACMYFFTSTQTTRVQSLDDIFWGGYFLVVPAIVFYYIQRQHVQFHELQVRLDANNFRDVALAVAKQLEWEVIEQSDRHMVAKNKGSWRSFGEHITIVREGDKVLFNSVGNPDAFYTIPYSGLNKRFRFFFEQMAIEALVSKSLATTETAVAALQD